MYFVVDVILLYIFLCEMTLQIVQHDDYHHLNVWTIISFQFIECVSSQVFREREKLFKSLTKKRNLLYSRFNFFFVQNCFLPIFFVDLY